MTDKQININAIAKIIQENFPDVAFAYLFGSAQTGAVKSGSDVDIAVFYKGNDLFIRLKIEELLEKELKGVPIDIIELQKVNPMLAFEALRGVQLFVRKEDVETYLNFYTLTRKLREDRTYWTKKQLEYRGYEVQWSNRIQTSSN